MQCHCQEQSDFYCRIILVLNLAYRHTENIKYMHKPAARFSPISLLQYKQGEWINKEVSSNFKPTFYPCSFSPATPTPKECIQQPLAHWQLHCILQNGSGEGRQHQCLRFLRSSRQVDCAGKNWQLGDLTVLIRSLIQVSKRGFFREIWEAWLIYPDPWNQSQDDSTGLGLGLRG